MLDFLVTFAQFVCFLGLIYGAIVCVAHHDCIDDLRTHYDPITSHDWLSLRPDTPPVRGDPIATEVRAGTRQLAA